MGGRPAAVTSGVSKDEDEVSVDDVSMFTLPMLLSFVACVSSMLMLCFVICSACRDFGDFSFRYKRCVYVARVLLCCYVDSDSAVLLLG